MATTRSEHHALHS